MSDAPISVLAIAVDDATLAALAATGLSLQVAENADAAHQHDVVLLAAPTHATLSALLQRNDLAQAAFDSTVVVQCGLADAGLELALFQRGVEAIVVAGDNAALLRGIHHALARKRLEHAARTAYATDLATGLPHQAQLLEHMTQLLALRGREPAPMVLLVLRIDGCASAAARLGSEAANILRRKVAVRLRSGLRASDVVAALGGDGYGVLLGHLESRDDGERVAAKLVSALQQPFLVAGQPCAVSTAVGLALYPEHGKDARTLLQRASAQAGSVATVGAAYAGHTERGPEAAANDDVS